MYKLTEPGKKYQVGSFYRYRLIPQMTKTRYKIGPLQSVFCFAYTGLNYFLASLSRAVNQILDPEQDSNEP
jgi:hypothetical protein